MCVWTAIPLMIIVRSGSADRAQNIRTYNYLLMDAFAVAIHHK